MDANDAEIQDTNTPLVLVCPLSPAKFVWEVTPEEAEQLEALLNAKKGEPGTLSRELRPMQPGDPSLIR